VRGVGYLTEHTDLLLNPGRINKMVLKNFEIARKNFSYEATASRTFYLGLIYNAGLGHKHPIVSELARLFGPPISN
jgi:hypothetical protein